MLKFNRYIELSEPCRTSNLQFFTALKFLRTLPDIKNVSQNDCDEAEVTWHYKVKKDLLALPENFCEALAFMNRRVVTGEKARAVIESTSSIVTAYWSMVNEYNMKACKRNKMRGSPSGRSTNAGRKITLMPTKTMETF